LQRLLTEFDLTHQEVAEAVGKSRVAVTNYLRLLNLADGVAELLSRGDIEMGHARALLSLTDDRQAEIARQVVGRGLNVRETEALVRRTLSGSKSKAKRGGARDADTRQLEQRLSTHIGQPVSIQHTAKGRGKLVISYNSLDELDGILNRFGDLD
ncbi:MAG TPA: ParB/RepB/Spo0J family partition protein, partial [Pseudomonadales bacterium]|nr:ParB/RepB/Spo0J family partition protein [Pseudomonadales bacterium]